MNDITRIDQSARRSRALIHDGIVYLSGQVPDDRSAGVQEQARQVLDKIDALLKEAGTSKSRILSAQIWLKTMDDFKQFNAVWDAWVTPGQTPTRSCGKVEMNDPQCLVEITVNAATEQK
ncbi:MAG: RidA family protein [Pigmentiphaga sp.]|nr:RidA family protein [Pigmentiphaga sp.]